MEEFASQICKFVQSEDSSRGRSGTEEQSYLSTSYQALLRGRLLSLVETRRVSVRDIC
jgi:hypothetical protein